MKKKYLLLLLLWCNSTLLMSQNTLQEKVAAFADMQILKNASLSIHVHDLDNNRSLAAFDENRSLSPASSIKLITTAIALDKLGKDFTYETKLAYNGNINAGTLDGDIVLIGSGDPSLGSDQMEDNLNYNQFFKSLVQKIKAQGIQNITGNIIVDASYFNDDATPSNYPWIDLGNYYASGAWALNIHENLYYLYFQQTPSLNDGPSVLNTYPKIDGLHFVNNLKNGSANSGDNAYIYGSPYGNKKYIRGSIPLGSGEFKIKGAIPNPPLHAAQKLMQSLKNEKIQINGQAKVSYKKSAASINVFYTHSSPNLLALCTRTNKKSVNVFAEAILKTLGKIYKNEGSFSKGTDFIAEYCKSVGIDTDGFYLKDGSGLSLNNGITAKQFTGILYHVFCNKNLYPLFKKSLVELEPGIQVKSGSMERVRSYTGYAQKKNGSTLAFSIIVNNYEGKSGPLLKAMKSLMKDMLLF